MGEHDYPENFTPHNANYLMVILVKKLIWFSVSPGSTNYIHLPFVMSSASASNAQDEQKPSPATVAPGKLKASAPAFQPSPKPALVKQLADNNKSAEKKLRPAPAFVPRNRQNRELETGLSNLQVSSEKSPADFVDEVGQSFYEPLKSNPQMPYSKPLSHYAVDGALHKTLMWEIHETNMVKPSNYPYQMHVYHSLSPLGSINIATISSPVHIQYIKAQSIDDGRQYCLCYVVSGTPQPTLKKAYLDAVERWKQIQSPNIAQVHDAFTTHALGDDSLVIVNELKPLVTTLKRRFVDQKQEATEPLLWSIVLQIASALKAIHSAGLAVQTLDLSTVLISPSNRVYLNSCGLADILSLPEGTSVDVAQQKDLRDLGKILKSILFINPVNRQLAPQSGSSSGRAGKGSVIKVAPGPSYSPSFRELFNYLNHKMPIFVSVGDILRLAGPQMFAELDASREESDALHDNLKLELANGRLARLLCKMNLVTQRANAGGDSEWSETGERYLIKLFCDYVFCLVDGDGKAVTDMAHVIGNLNKLDAGSSEKVMLMSQDEKSCLVVTYKEIKRCIETAYAELLSPPNNSINI